MSKAVDSLPPMQAGWVWLVGAGPGDPALLTLGAYDALQQADIVVHDSLVSEAVLALVPESSVCEPAGKRGGRDSPRQASITRRLIDLAHAGYKTVRLKGGDPFVFGRGPEEARALVQAGVSVRIVPGIPAGVGGLAYAGIPVTAGGVNDAVIFLTGHGPDGGFPETLDWAAIARGAPVIVAYMALRQAEPLSSRLRGGGRSADEPVAVVYSATLPDQWVLETTLSCLPHDVRRTEAQGPALIVIGPVVDLRGVLGSAGVNPVPLSS